MLLKLTACFLLLLFFVNFFFRKLLFLLLFCAITQLQTNASLTNQVEEVIFEAVEALVGVDATAITCNRKPLCIHMYTYIMYTYTHTYTCLLICTIQVTYTTWRRILCQQPSIFDMRLTLPLALALAMALAMAMASASALSWQRIKYERNFVELLMALR